MISEGKDEREALQAAMAFFKRGVELLFRKSITCGLRENSSD